MRLSNIVLILGLSGVFAIATVFLASVLFTEFNLWDKTLSAAQVRVLPSLFTAASMIFIAVGVFFRIRSNQSDFEI